MFIGREAEFKQLDKFYNSEQFEMLIVYGRRRVGKTKLLTEFIKGKNAIFYAAEENNDQLNRRKFEREILEHLNMDIQMNMKYWEDIFKFLVNEIGDERLVLVIDELPYLAKGNSSFLSMLQNVIDHYLLDKNILLILCGSSISFMEDELVAHKSPLYGRKTGQMKIQPFDFFDAVKFFQEYSTIDKFRLYSVIGGIPHYLIRVDHTKTVDENISNLLFNSSSFLYDEPRNLLHQELRTPGVYNSIIEAVSTGSSKLNDIATKIGEPQGKTSKYIKSLLELELIERRHPIGTERSKKSIYRVSDKLFNFLYRYVYTHRGIIEQELGEVYYKKNVKTAMDNLYGLIFEEVCIQYLIRKNKKLELDDLIEDFGTWWGGNPQTKKQEEIDIVGLSDETGIYGECKYRNEMLKLPVLNKLEERSNLISRENKVYFLFSKTGFARDLIDVSLDREDVYLKTLEDMMNEIQYK